jgi:hypothetical protein
VRPKVAIGTQWKFLRLANFCPPRSLSVLASVRANGILQQSRRRETNRLFAEISAYIGNPTTSGTSLARSPQAGRLLIGQRLIIVWLQVRVLPSPPRSPVKAEISSCLSEKEKRRDEARNVGLGPAHDWSSHACDSFGLMAIVYEEPPIRGGINRRRPNPQPTGRHWSA